LGKSLTLDGKDYTIIGVIPQRLISWGVSIQDRYMCRLGNRNNPLLMNRAADLHRWNRGALKPGITVQQARADMDA